MKWVEKCLVSGSSSVLQLGNNCYCAGKECLKTLSKGKEAPMVALVCLSVCVDADACRSAVEDVIKF